MSSIQIQNVTKRFGDFTAVDNISIDIEEGEFVALLGPSGCGKTTTMNMIAGLEDATEGAILFDNQDLGHVRMQDRNIGFVFQNYAIFTHLSVYKNLSYGLEVKKVGKSEIERRVKAMADRMSISHRLDQPASSLSVNEMQKLAIGRSAIVEPRIFLLDEPLSNLDAGFRAYMRAELKVLQHEFGQTMIYVTHDQIEAMSLADKIAIIDQGKLMQYGAPLDIYNDPQNRFVANFVGSPRMNLVDGELREEQGALRLMLHGGAEIRLDGQVKTAFTSDAKVHSGSFGIRPQDIYFGEKRADNDIRMQGKVEVLERVGPKRLAYLQVQETMFLAFDDQAQLRVGDDVPFYLPSGASMAFDLESGRRLGGQ
ncbi:ABC transporter ATP-binding protein [Ruegeria pomeroyi]|uniref:ABC transporter ATP-binding protein n=1 Tax=Ruegeria alba TaxID=2916756 RepID=A0ABS9P0Y4_9RHOB|nr:ABC transporter ATP-binding protein [Ruegeria alba]MCE8514731.1 ABC transporter ATP-binding protein [Ruegeria pomeroyi]MCE8525608.1 ABC transporter ATP-binding protein [Ruegeria pomeroyi]MCE8548421.1 ABC transporter ATP-binding protein [Ruegeria pomeroyi]MCG6560148.1 ABC transporter ATP-binding protein [Ruegeria alba]